MPVFGLAIVLAVFQVNLSEQGMKALDEKRYDAAIQSFTSAIAADPTDYSAHFNLALAYSLSAKDAEAVAEYRKTLELKPGLYEADLNLGILLLRDKRASEAIPYLNEAASSKPKEARPNLYLGDALLALAQYPKASDAYQAVLAADPSSAPAEVGLAQAQLRSGHIDDAAPHFQKAVALDARYRGALLELGSAYEAAKRALDAIAIYKQFPEDAGAQEHLGQLLLADGQAADAIARLENAVKESPTPAKEAALAAAYVRNHQPEQARPLIEHALLAEPNDYDLWMVHGRILRDQRKFEPASRDFAKAAQLRPDAAEAWSELAGVQVMAENYAGGLASLDRIAALHAEKPGHIYLRAITLDRIKQQKPALEAYQRFLGVSHGQFPDEEFKARQRARILEHELSRR